MGWLSNLFASRRELKRLAKSVNFWQARALSLEKELKTKDDLHFERQLLLMDRALTASGRFAIADEAEHKLYLKDGVAQKQEADEALKAYLQAKQNQLLDDAREAKLSDQAAYDLYKRDEADYIEDFQAMTGF